MKTCVNSTSLIAYITVPSGRYTSHYCYPNFENPCLKKIVKLNAVSGYSFVTWTFSESNLPQTKGYVQSGLVSLLIFASHQVLPPPPETEAFLWRCIEQSDSSPQLARHLLLKEIFVRDNTEPAPI